MFFKLYFSNIAKNFILILDIMIIIVISNSLTIGAIALFSEHNWYVGTEDAYILSFNQEYDNDERYDMVQKLISMEGITDVGYSVSGSTRLKGTSYSAIYYSPPLYRMKNRVSIGKWFDDATTKQAILCGQRLCASEKINSTVTLNNIESQVIGMIRYFPRVMELNKNDEKEVFDLSTLSIDAENYILTNCIEVLESDGGLTYGVNVVLFTDGNFEISTLSYLGHINHIDDYKEASSDRYRVENSIELLTGILTISILLIIIEAVKRMLINNNTSVAQVLKYCGILCSGYIKLMTGHIIINVSIALLISYVLMDGGLFMTSVFWNGGINYISVICTSVIVIIIIGITIVTSIKQYNDLK